MDAEAQLREQWALGLHLFLGSRLRTPAYVMAMRAYPHITVPAMVPQTQYLLDGVAWAINDHPGWSPQAWRVTRSHLKEAAERYDEVREQLSAPASESFAAPALGLAAATPAGGAAVGERADLASGELRTRDADMARRRMTQHREHVYRAHAAMQDLYMAFCLVDLFVKGDIAAAGVGGALRDTVERDLPRMVCDYMPLFTPQGSAWAEDAVEEYRVLFLDLLRSWGGVRLPTRRQLEEHVGHKIRRAREVVEQRAGGGAREGARLMLLQGDLAAFFDTGATVAEAGGRFARCDAGEGLQGAASSSGRSTSVAVTAGPRTAELAERAVRSFVASIFPGKRSAAYRVRCPHCGLLLRDENARSAHYRCHFYNHNYLKPDLKVARLTYPSAEEFVSHMGDVHRTGYFVRVTDALEEAYKSGAPGAVRTRASADATAVSTSPQ